MPPTHTQSPHKKHKKKFDLNKNIINLYLKHAETNIKVWKEAKNVSLMVG
jgi:hypothetical protein